MVKSLWEDHYKSRSVSSEEAVSSIKDGSRVFLDGNAAMPKCLVNALIEHAKGLTRVELNHLLVFGDDPFASCPAIYNNAWFLGPGVRKAVHSGQAGLYPHFPK